MSVLCSRVQNPTMRLAARAQLGKATAPGRYAPTSRPTSPHTRRLIYISSYEPKRPSIGLAIGVRLIYIGSRLEILSRYSHETPAYRMIGLQLGPWDLMCR